MKKIYTFIKHFITHFFSGMPKSSQREINRRYQICTECKEFSPELKQCTVCECNVNKKKILMNKLAWKDQKCPLSKW